MKFTEQEFLDALLLAVNEAQAWAEESNGYTERTHELAPCYKILDSYGIDTRAKDGST